MLVLKEARGQMRMEGRENGRVNATSFGPATEVSHRRASVAHGSVGARTPTSMSAASFSKGRPGEVSVEQLRQPYVLTSTDPLFQFPRDGREGPCVVTTAPEALALPRPAATLATVSPSPAARAGRCGGRSRRARCRLPCVPR